MTSVLALIGAAFLYTGCVKDYSEDISSIKKELEDLKNGTVADLKTQVNSLKESVKSLDEIDKQLKNDISALETAYKEADAKLQTAINENATNIKALQNEVATIQNAISTLKSKVEANEAAIVKCNEAIQGTKDWATQTFATKSALETVSTTLGNLAQTVTDLDTRLKDVDVKLSNELSAVKTTAEKAASDVSYALGEIEKIKQNFNNYYKKGEIDAKISDINDVIEGMKDDKKGLEEDVNKLKEADSELEKKISDLSDALDTDIEARIKKEGELDQRITDEVKKLQDQIDDLVEIEIEKALEKINTSLAALACRVNSISVCPSKVDEIITIKIGDQSANLFKATFEIRPASRAANIKKEELNLVYAEATPRSKSIDDAVEYKEATIDSVYAEGPRVVVIAKDIDTLKSDSNAHFFALTYNGKDAQGEYDVTSDYAQAIEGNNDVFDLISYIKYSVRGVTSIAKTLIVPIKVDYIEAAKEEKVFTPFKDFALVYNNAKLKSFIPETLTLEEFTEWTGIELNCVPKYTIDYPLISVEQDGLNTTDRFDNTVDLSKHVREQPYFYITLEYTINNQTFSRILKQQTTLTDIP